MSNTIEQRVVEMRFDNSHFAKGVSATLSMLEKLKEKLNFSGATKGLDDINASAKRVDMASLGGAVDTVSAKFSALQVMGVTALANITNSAVNAGKNIVKALTIDPIKSGFSEYETKMGSIQTILANTEHQGTTMDEVTAALDELNLYADKTIYNFQEMTRNIGTFTAAGVDLETSVRSIQGIANLAAVSGSTSQQASTAMYQLSQALATGTVKLQDWNSVVNAGMGGKVFQNALIQTAAMLDKSSENVAAWQAEHIDAYGSFRDSLTQGGWLTTEVLTKTLEQFTMAAEEGSEEWEKFKESLMIEGYTEEQAESILKMANTATDAATKVKTFTQLLDTLKESAQSGWAQTWELIIGDFEEAKAFFTELSDLFGGIIGRSAERRNTLISDTMSSNWDKLIKKINDAGVKTEEFEECIRKVVGDNKLDSLIEEYGSLEAAVKKGKISSEELKKALDNIAGTSADSKIAEFVKGIKEIDRTLRRGDIGEDVEKLQTALEGLGYDLGEAGIDGIIGPITEKAIKAFQEANGLIADGVVGPETLEALEKAGTKLEETTRDVDKLKESCDSLIDVVTKTSGRELLLGSLKNVIEAIMKPLQALGKAWGEVFSIESDQLYSALEGLNRFTKALVISDETSEKLTRTFKGLFSIIKIITTIVGGGFKLAFSGLTIFLERFDMDLLDFTAMVGDALAAVSDFINGVIDSGFNAIFNWLLPKLENAITAFGTFKSIVVDALTNVIETISGWFNSLKDINIFTKMATAFKNAVSKIAKAVDAATELIVEGISKWIDKIKESTVIQECAKWFTNAANAISDAIDNITTKISNFNFSSLTDRVSSFGSFISDVASKLKNSEIFITVVDAITDAFGKLRDALPKFKLPEATETNVKDFTKFLARFEKLETGDIIEVLTNFKTHALDFFKLKWNKFSTAAFEKFATFWIKSGDLVKKAFEKCKEIATAIKEFIFGAEEVSLPTILSVAEKFLTILTLLAALKAIKGLTAPFENITSAIQNLTASTKWNAVSDAFKSMAIALGVFTVCLMIITKMEGDVGKAAGILIGLIAVMSIAVTAMGIISSKFDNGLDTAKASLSLLALASTLMILVKTLERIDKLNLKHPFKSILILTGMILGMATAFRIMSKAANASFSYVASVLTLVTALNLVLDVIDAYDQHNWEGQGDAIRRMVNMLMILSVAIAVASSGLRPDAKAGGLAFLILSMVLSLKLILELMKDFAALDDRTIEKGGGVIVKLLGVMTIMSVALSLANKGSVLEKGQKSVNNFAGLAMALLAVVAAIWLLGKMDLDTLRQGGFAVGQILLMFTGMLAALGKSCSGLKMGVIIAMIVSVGLLMAEMALLIRWLKDIPWENSVGSAGALGLLLLAIAGMLKTLTKCRAGTKTIVKWIGIMTALAGVIFVLSYVLQKMKDIHPANSIGSAVALGVLLAAMAGVLHILSGLDMRHFSNAKLKKLAIMFGGLTAILVGLSLVLGLMSWLKASNAVQNVIALSGLLAAMSGVMYILGGLDMRHFSNAKLKKLAIMFTGLAIVLAALGGVLALMTAMDVKNAIPNATALSILAGVLSGVMLVLSGIKFNKTIYSGILGFVLVAASLLILVEVLNRMSGVENATNNAIALSLFTAALAVCMIPIAAAGKLAKTGTLIVGVIALAGLMLSMNLLVDVLSDMQGISNARENAISLAILAGALSLCLLPLTLAGYFAWGALAGVVAIALLMASLNIVVDVLSDMQNIKNADTNARVLGELVVALSKALTPLALISILVYPALVAVGALALMMWSLKIVVGVLAAMDGLNNAQANADIITQLLTVLTDTITQVCGLGPSAVLGAIAVNALITMVAKLGMLAVAVGWLSDHWDNLDKFVDSGIDIFIRLARGLGEMVSAFVGGLMGELPNVGESLSSFMDSAGTFIDKVKSVDDSVVTGAGNLAAAITKLLGAEFLAGLSERAGLTLSDLAVELSTFAEEIGGFITSMTEINPESAAGVDALCSAIDALSTANIKDTIANLLPGDNSLSTFGANISSFATCIKSAAESLAGITDADVENIKRSATAGNALAELNQAIPSQDGLVQDIIGSKELDVFGQSALAFADCIVGYSEKVSGKTIDAEAIKASATAASALVDVANALPASGGVWQEWTGEKNLATWGSTLAEFATGLVNYSGVVSEKEIDGEAITKSADAAAALVAVANELPSTDGVWQEWTGEKNLGTFGTQLVGFAEGIVAYADVASTLSDDKITAIENSGDAIDKLVDVMEKIPETGGWGDKVFGSSDGQSFGAALRSVASGVVKYCDMASGITEDDVTAIDNSKTAIEKLGTVVTSLPETTQSDKAIALNTAADNLITIGSKLNTLTSSEYDYSGLDSLKIQIGTIGGIFGEIDTSSLVDKFLSMKTAVTYAATCAEKISALSTYTYDGVGSFKTAITELGTVNMDALITAFSGKASEVGNAVTSLMNTMSNRIKLGSSGVSGAMKDTIDSTLKTITDRTTDFIKAGRSLLTELARGITDKEKLVKTAAKNAAGKAVSGAKEKYESMKSAGEYLGDGLVLGIEAKVDDAYEAGYALGQAAVQGEKDGQNSASPSKDTIKAGKWLGEGLIIGISKMGRAVYNAGSSMGSGAVKSISKSISRISDIVESDIDAQPTIRPVLDLSNVESGAGYISSLLGSGTSVGVMSNIGAISTMMNRRSQNGAESEVVTAINKLRKDLGNVGNTTYQVNGITYDDGSNVSTAVQDLIRAARIERRV